MLAVADLWGEPRLDALPSGRYSLTEHSVNVLQTSRRRKAERRRDQLIDTAFAVFAEKGVHAATVKDLSVAAGVAPGLLYHYFRSKEDLLYAALERRYFVPELRRLASPERDEPAAHVLGEVAAEFAAVLRNNQQFVRVVLAGGAAGQPAGFRTDRARQTRGSRLARGISRVARHGGRTPISRCADDSPATAVRDLDGPLHGNIRRGVSAPGGGHDRSRRRRQIAGAARRKHGHYANSNYAQDGSAGRADT